MGNKRNSKSVVITIIVTVIVLTVLSVIGIRYLMPYYAQDPNAEDMQYTIYQFAVRLFPLLVGIVLIIIASMIAANRDDDVDEDDLLPPNSYDQQLFEVPSDDPVRRPQQKTQPKPETKKTEEAEPEVISSDSISDDDFFAIFGEPEKKETPVEEVSEETAEDEVIEETAPEAESEVAPVLDEEAETEAEPEVEPVEEEKKPEEEVAPIEPQSTPAPTETNAADNKLVDAVYALVNKLDEMADLITYEDDEEEEEKPEPTPAPAPTPIPQPQPVYYYQPPVANNYSALENKIDKLCDSIAMLTQLVTSGYVAAAAAAPVAPAPQPQAKPEPKTEPKVEEPKPQPKPVKIEEPAVVVEPPKPVAEKAEDPANQVINDYDATDPMHLMKIEFDSAQEDEYDITFAFTKASADKIKMSLAEVADAYEVNNKTIVVIPFLSYDEAMAELDRENVSCSNTIFVAAGQKEDFDSLIAPQIG